MLKSLLGGAAALCLSLGLGACGQPPAQVAATAATVSAAVIPPADLAMVQKLCSAAQAPLAAAAASGSKVGDVAVYPAAYCQQLAAAPAGQVPATTNSNTLPWLQMGVQLAGIVLPLLL